MNVRKALFVAPASRRRWGATARISRNGAALAAAVLVVGVISATATPAAAAPVGVPVDPPQARMSAHVGWDADVSARPDAGDCARYGSAPDGTTTGAVANAGGSAGTEAAAWTDGVTAWAGAGTTAYSAHGIAAGQCDGGELNLSTQSAIGFSPAGVTSVPIGEPFNLGRMVHVNNPVHIVNSWYRGLIELRVLGLDLSYEWRLHETTNSAAEPSDPRNNDVLDFLSTVGERSIEIDGVPYTVVVNGFTAPTLPGDQCAPTLADPGVAINRFETVERTTTYGCLYAEIQQVRTLTVQKVAEAAHAPEQGIPAFDFTASSDLSGSAWTGSFPLTPSGLGVEGAAATEPRTIVVGESVTIVENAAAPPWVLTDVTCIDGAGSPVGFVRENAAITLTPSAVATAEAAPITCTFTNTDATIVEPKGALRIVKTVSPTEGTPAAGYTGGGARTFLVDWACTLGGIETARGTASVSTAVPSEIFDLPAGAECTITGEDDRPLAGDFADETYAWDGFAVSRTVTIAEGGAAVLTIDNRFAQTTVPTEPTSPTEPTPPGPLPLTDGPAQGALALTGTGPVLPVVAVGALLLAVGILTLASVLRARRRG